MNQPRPSLALFERLVANRDLANAFQVLLQLLQAIDDRYGRLENIEIGQLNTNGTD